MQKIRYIHDVSSAYMRMQHRGEILPKSKNTFIDNFSDNVATHIKIHPKIVYLSF